MARAKGSKIGNDFRPRCIATKTSAQRFMILALVGATVVCPAGAEPPFDNLYLDAGAGRERPDGEDSTGFATLGMNWGIPLTPPSNVALGLQLGGDIKL